MLLITLDTTRYNALGCYGNPADPTPNIDRLAAEGVLYSRARSVTPLTLPAHTSMLTGLYPNRHSVFANGLNSVPQSASTLAELARAQCDAQTSAFVASIVLDESFELDQGFETYEGAPRESSGPGGLRGLPAPEIVARATRWLDARDRDRPFFTWMHFYDAHTPWNPPPELAERMRSQYLGEVAFIDQSLGPLFDHLRADGTLAETLVIVVGDHGESFNAHGEPTHGWYCYDGTLRVPFILRYPDGFRAGTKSDELVSVVDVYPTALAALGLAPPPDLDGVDLYRAEVPAERGVYFESYNGWLSFGWSPIVGWCDARGKYIHSSSPEFFDVIGDKQENKNVIAERGADVERALRSLRGIQARRKLSIDAVPVVGQDMRDALKSLGYVGADAPLRALPDPLHAEDLPSPRERRDELAAFHAAQSAGEEGRLEEAVGLLRELLVRYPANVIARNYLANDLMQLKRYAEAREVLEELARVGSARAADYNNLGACCEATGDFAAAKAAYRTALDMDPNEQRARAGLDRLGN